MTVEGQFYVTGIAGCYWNIKKFYEPYYNNLDYLSLFLMRFFFFKIMNGELKEFSFDRNDNLTVTFPFDYLVKYTRQKFFNKKFR